MPLAGSPPVLIARKLETRREYSPHPHHQFFKEIGNLLIRCYH